MVTARHDPPTRRVSGEEYLAFERASQTKHELIDGRIVAMAGASEAHSLIQSAVNAQLYLQTRGRRCFVYSSDIRVQVDDSHYFYPDLTVVCGRRLLAEGVKPDTLLNPTVVVEIDSPSTRFYDRHYKVVRYMGIQSLRHIVLVEQEVFAISLYTRAEGQNWTFVRSVGLESSITLSAIGCTLALADVYENVVFPPEDDVEEGG
jgi:Uma2 family endonuclease